MKRRNFSLLLFLLSIALIIFLFKGLAALERKESSARSDIIWIKSTEAFEKHERADVIFLHDRHTKIAESMKKDCSLCHFKLEEGLFEDSFSPKFKRLEDKSKQELMDIYHENCVGCHEKSSSPEKSGPVLCEGCHKKKPLFTNARQAAGFDKSLHYRHSQALEEDCEACHHESGSCRYCHKEKETEEYPMSMEKAAHASCAGCHLKDKNEDKISGPTNCSGCHGVKEQQAIKKLDVVPILKLEEPQPDWLIIKASEDLEPGLKKLMSFVPFNHKAHEENVDSCRECHHQELIACHNCHTLKGKEEGGFLNLQNIMHKTDAKINCVGCHNEQQKKPECAGCHSFAEMIRKRDESSCLACHLSKPSELSVLKNNNDAAAAKKLLTLKKPVGGGLEGMKIPETIVIKYLSKKYGPVNFPHLKVIKSLAAKIKSDRLADFFHREKETVCKGCHHNSPKSDNPPRCVSCHYQSYSLDHPLQPGIVGAYHVQCAGCHDRMKIEKFTECEDCHKSIETR